MNFLSHYYIRHQVAHPHFTLGKILPDMLRPFGPANKIRHAANIKAPETEMEWLIKGTFTHLETDRIFHASDFFEQKTASIKQFIKAEKLFGKYKFFYAHLLLELLLDRILVKHHNDVAPTFYRQLNEVNQATISGFFRYKGLQFSDEQFFRSLDRFTSSRYLFSYAENEGLTFALERTVNHVGLPVFGKSDKKTLINNLDELEATVAADYLSIFKKLEKVIPE